MFRVIIAGSRNFSDFAFLQKKMDFLLQNVIDQVEILCGEARGADALGKKYALQKGYSCASFPADWKKYGRAAGPMRNRDMAKNADACVCFWDGKSKGTENMIDEARKAGLCLRVYLDGKRMFS